MEISRSVRVDAPAELVWGLVSDLPSMGQLSPENAGGSWRAGATGPVVGARFKGRNRSGRRRWRTSVQVLRAEPGKSFTFAVSSVGLPVAEWSYLIAADSERACTVTETWTDRRGRAVRLGGALLTGVKDREPHTATNIEATLTALKAKAESA